MKINYVNGQEITIPEVQKAMDKLEEPKSNHVLLNILLWWILTARNGQRSPKTLDHGNGTSTIDDLGFKCVYKYKAMKKTYKKLHKVEQKYKKLFYKMLYKYMESWWD